ncbi:MAG: aspartate carbamoyltransferase regulatory subunit [Marinifilaceae bacterium]|nr:aspartate carbamoyltransferase regulatory subunit [Marinifilaceae bacterium]
MTGKKELQVSAIENGTVIDRIPSNKLFTVISILGLDNTDLTMTFGMNLNSNALGNKAIIKLWDKYLADEEINKLALVSKDIKINIIKNYEVVEKKVVSLPESINGIVRCVNPKCVTNCEGVSTRFNVVSKEPIAIQCCYCEKIFEEKRIEII